MSGRKLRPDELDLWGKVASQVTPMDPKPKIVLPAQSKPAPEVSEPKPAFRVKALPTISGGKASLQNDLAPSLQNALREEPVQMDRKAFKKLQRGKLKPEGRIDLHGMTLDRAHGALTRFILSSHGSGKRLLLVITGKGKHRDEGGPIPVRMGVLRHQVPEWLRLPPLNSMVMQVTQAHISHGGGGAYYVYLRRSR